VAKEVLAILDAGKANFKPIYDVKLPIKEKIGIIAKEIYGADGVDFTAAAEKSIHSSSRSAWGRPGLHRQEPVLLLRRPDQARPSHRFRITVRDVTPSAGAGFVVALAGDIMTMPGLSALPRPRISGSRRRGDRRIVLADR